MRRREDRLTQLTERERSILGLLAEGRSNRSIADRLMLSVKTIEGSIASIFNRLGLDADPDDNRRVLAVLAYLDTGRRPTNRGKRTTLSHSLTAFSAPLPPQTTIVGQDNVGVLDDSFE